MEGGIQHLAESLLLHILEYISTRELLQVLSVVSKELRDVVQKVPVFAIDLNELGPGAKQVWMKKNALSIIVHHSPLIFHQLC